MGEKGREALRRLLLCAEHNADGLIAIDVVMRVLEHHPNTVIAGLDLKVREAAWRDQRVVVLTMHKPSPVEVELWCHDEGVTPLHDENFPDCADGTCAGHLRTIPSCMECGYEVDYDGTVNYTKWPCSTARALGVSE